MLFILATVKSIPTKEKSYFLDVNEMGMKISDKISDKMTD